MKKPSFIPARVRAGILLAALAACGDPVGPQLPELVVVAAAGDGQFGVPGQVLPTRLHAVVRRASTSVPREDVTMRWEVESGDASFMTGAATVTDSTGSTYATVRLGNMVGDVVLRVTAVEQETATVTFTVHAVESPQVTGLSVSEAQAGDTITVEGLNFLPDPSQNVVLFSGIRGSVVSTQAGGLQVEVPRCLPDRVVDVSVLLGPVASSSLPLSVTDDGQATYLFPGEVRDIADPAAPGCLRLPGGAGQSYLAMVYSAGTVGAAAYAASFHGLADSPSGLAVAPGVASQPSPTRVETSLGGFQEAWDRELRLREADLLSTPYMGGAEAHRASAREEVPSVGHERTFNVLNAEGTLDEVVAVARYVGERAVLYEDNDAPDGGFTVADLQAFSATFDETIYPTVTGAFGSPSDLDGNDRIVILFTGAVNRLSPRGSDGFVGGFFYGLDLLTEREGSNRGEIFYALVPDPLGQIADPHPKSQVLDVTPAILAHEFQHMVQFNQRVLEGGADGNEALWLSEGLAQMAEELVARAYLAVGDPLSAEDFRSGNRIRAQRYLEDPLSVSLIVTTGQGSLGERGAGWLHVLYLVERYGEDILRRLTASTRIGADNIEYEAGRPWEGILADWWASLYLAGRGDYGVDLGFGSFDLRDFVIRSNGSDGLQPTQLGQTDFHEELSFWSSSVRYYILRPPVGGSTVIRLGGEGGGTAPAGSALGLRIVRLF